MSLLNNQLWGPGWTNHSGIRRKSIPGRRQHQTKARPRPQVRRQLAYRSATSLWQRQRDEVGGAGRGLASFREPGRDSTFYSHRWCHHWSILSNGVAGLPFYSSNIGSPCKYVWNGVSKKANLGEINCECVCTLVFSHADTLGFIAKDLDFI